MVICGCLHVGGHIQSWAIVAMWAVFILVNGRHLWVLVVKRGVVVGDCVVVVVVFPCCPGVWAFIVLKVAVNMAHKVYMCAMSVVLWWHCLLGTTSSWL